MNQFSLGCKNISLNRLVSKRYMGRETGTGNRSPGPQQPEPEIHALGLFLLPSLLFDFLLCCDKSLIAGAAPGTAVHQRGKKGLP